MRQRLVRWVEWVGERLDERMCALANLTDDGDDEPTSITLSESLARTLARTLGDNRVA